MRMVRTRQAGLTLIECLVSVLILAVGLLGVSAALTAALTSNQKASQISYATAIVQDTVEEMRSLGYGAIDFETFPESIPVSGLHSGVRTIEIEEAYAGSPRLKRVVVTVSWRGHDGRTAHVMAETLVGNRGNHAQG